MEQFKKLITDALESVGVTINGKHPWDVQINNEHIYHRIMHDGDVGVGEGYMYGEWDAGKLDELIYRAHMNDSFEKIFQNPRVMFHILPQIMIEKIAPHNDPYKVGEKHYDIGNDLYRAMLDKRMVYTCGYWKKARTLDEAQIDKLELVCQKLYVKKGMRILDIGGGWGSFAKFAAERYEVTVVNISISKEQVALANTLCKGLPVENRLQDYRDVTDGPYDRIVSLGMFEHVGSQHYNAYFDSVRRNLKDDGLFLLHTIGSYHTEQLNTSWVGKYIFPNSEIPTLSKVTKVTENIFIIEDMHNFGADYDKTLLAWYANFEKHWPIVKKNYDDTFYRMWKLYLLGSAAAFRARKLHLWQFVMSKNGVKNGYIPVR